MVPLEISLLRWGKKIKEPNPKKKKETRAKGKEREKQKWLVSPRGMGVCRRRR